ncbi:calpain-A-like [Elysia marginata]|uniref:Calpain-A-like n=1 Tax=Elysia marginata TaxID=1093978 RepID=A0AAV4EA87_9GAST|nr:calpain-A-like [Elysia marginata]
MTRRIFSQDYVSIQAQCVRQGRLFEDPEFPAEDASIFYSRAPPRRYEWKRPSEICSNPQWMSNGATRFDVKQGELDNFWFVSAVASLASEETLMERVVDSSQRFDRSYGGLFKFSFWVQGQWQDVVVDDRLPTFNNQLCFVHSANRNEFWSALLEKAYAKLYGSYEALKDGNLSEAMVDFTGGVPEKFDLKNAPSNLYQMMLKARQRSSLLGCLIESERERELANGLVAGQCYSITSVLLIDIKTTRREAKVPLVRLRNPRGDGTEWTGPWSDKSREWSLISANERSEAGLTFEQDGEFWMSFNDFCKNFDTLEICHLGPDSIENSRRTAWASRKENGVWRRRASAGGCRNYINTFWTNPQYRVTLTDPDEDDDDNSCTALICLMQKDRRLKRKEGKQNLNIGYYIYEVHIVSIGDLSRNNIIYMSLVLAYYLSSTFKAMTFQVKTMLDLDHYPEACRRYWESDEISSLVKPEDPELTGNDARLRQQMLSTFDRISGADKEIDPYELKDILNTAFSRVTEFASREFSIGKAKSLKDKTGKIGFEEFSGLWDDIRLWKSVFKKYDADGSGMFDTYELRQALHASGFRLSNGALNTAVMRSSNRKGKIEFPDFIFLMAKLKAAHDTFTANVVTQGKAQFRLDEVTIARDRALNFLVTLDSPIWTGNGEVLPRNSLEQKV